MQSSAVLCPMTREAFPRRSSAASGFFFWGMSDEPVEYESPHLTNPA